MNWVDVLVLLLALIAGIAGAQQGSVTALASFAGVLGGAVLGVRVAPVLVEQLANPVARVAFGVAVVVLLVALGETLGVAVGRALRDRINGHRTRQLDSALGSVVQALAVLAVAWLVALPLTSSGFAEITAAVRRSAVLSAVDRVMPDFARRLPAELTRLLDFSGFPDVLAPFAATPITEVGPADPALLNSPVVRAAEESVLKIRGQAPSCSRALEGTGFVVAPERVLTNAHVVAGTSSVEVDTLDDGAMEATVVSFDPGTDVAVLAVPGLDAPVLPFAPADAETGQDAIVLGYPLDGPYTAAAARVRERVQLRGPDIYSSRMVVRDVYTVRAVVRSGNSGGPLLDTRGRVLGVVFGAAVDDEDTGFVLTDDEVVDDVADAEDLSDEVSTGSCAA